MFIYEEEISCTFACGPRTSSVKKAFWLGAMSTKGTSCKENKTKNSAHPKLPDAAATPICSMKENIRSLRAIFDRLNERHFPAGRLRGYKVMWAGAKAACPKEYFFSGRSRKKTGLFESIRSWISLLFRFGFSSTCSTTKCCTRWCPMKWDPMDGGGFTPKNSIGANASSRVTGGRGVGRKRISRVSCASASPSKSVAHPARQTARVSLLRSF